MYKWEPGQIQRYTGIVLLLKRIIYCPSCTSDSNGISECGLWSDIMLLSVINNDAVTFGGDDDVTFRFVFAKSCISTPSCIILDFIGSIGLVPGIFICDLSVFPSGNSPLLNKLSCLLVFSWIYASILLSLIPFRLGLDMFY